ncbi:hypothetical protein D0859_15684 [Hortaea werneckii]|uniref:Uncharacterized protein n=1 Tax=Hortaea werneckii TaxID=91943 RepID=A0A3M7I4N8_HORWE|nr:hypothetical protein D0859_15684 [Hortaea werneckii]
MQEEKGQIAAVAAYPTQVVLIAGVSKSSPAAVSMALVDRSEVASLYTRILLHDLNVHNPNLPPLNADITNTILSFLGLDFSSLNKLHHLPSNLACPNALPAMNDNHPAQTPPPDGKCPFMTLPTELRRAIFADSLPARDVAIPVRCEDDDHGAHKQNSKKNNHAGEGDRTHSPVSSTATSSSSSSSSPSSPSSPAGPSATPVKVNRTADLMTLNRRLCAEITEVLYTEREFVVHVREGFHSGGIEFLTSGRQPLQFYCLPSSDDDGADDGCGGRGGGPGGGGRMKDPRFGGKFHSGAPFGLDRVKKVRVEILPPPLPSFSSGKEEEANGRMVSMNTYFMVLALVRLLERAEGPGRDSRITRLRVVFADRCRRRRGRNDDDNSNPTSTSPSTSNPASSASESSWWWDPHRSRPRETTFHGTSNLQLILLPFSRLRAHQVEILLPPSCATQLASDPPTRSFLRRLEGKITGPSSSSSSSATGLDDLLDDGKVLSNLETARFAYEAFVFRIKFGSGKGEEVAMLGEGDWEGEKAQETAVGEEEEEKEEGRKDGEVSEGDWPAQGRRAKKTKSEKKKEKKQQKKEEKKNEKGKNSKGKRRVGAGDGDDEEDDGEEMQWALHQSLQQAAGEEEKELEQAIRESLRYDREDNPEPARMDDRNKKYHVVTSEEREEIKFGGDEYEMGLSEDMEEFGFEDDEDDEALSEDMGEDESQDCESHEEGKTFTRETDPEPNEYDTARPGEDTETTDSGDEEEYWHGHYKATEEGRAKARALRTISKEKKDSQPYLPLTEAFGTTGSMAADIWQVTGTTSINSSTTFPEGARFGQPVAAKRGPFAVVVEGGPGERMDPYAVETGWGEEAVSVLERMTPESIAEAAAPPSDGVASGNSDSLNVVLENGVGV